MFQVHDPNKELHMCQKCGKEYASSFAFRTHMALHAANEGELMCGKYFTNVYDKMGLSSHKLHLDIQNYYLKNSLSV